MHQLSARQIAGQGNLICFLAAVSLQSMAAELCCDLLEQGKADAAQVQAMAALWEKEPAAAEKLLKVGASPRDPKADPVELAAWTVVTSTLLNLDEAISKP